MAFSEKQQEFFMNATHRWNIKTGATRSGKTHMDYFVIPKRIRKCTGRGLIVLIGNTLGTLERNILTPMRNIWGERFVGKIGRNNSVKLFGHEAFMFGADTKISVERIQGAGIEYGYGDEITTWNQEVFEMLKTRLDKENSVFDGTCNPDNPQHWFKKFLDSDADIYQQKYILDDNIFLPRDFKENLKKELAGTVYYDRFILGNWVAAQGIIYQLYAANPGAYDVTFVNKNEIILINIGVDFGGNKSGTTFVATAFMQGWERIVVLKSRKIQTILDPEHLNRLFVEFIKEVTTEYDRAVTAYCDNAEPTLIAGLKKASREAGLPCTVRNAAKGPINNRIRLTSGLISQNRLNLMPECKTLKTALSEALWNDKKLEDERLDDGTTDIDTLDAFEYSIESESRRLLNATFSTAPR